MGATSEELGQLKRVVQYAVYAAYHLGLETSFLADEGAVAPTLTPHIASFATSSANSSVASWEAFRWFTRGISDASEWSSSGPPTSDEKLVVSASANNAMTKVNGREGDAAEKNGEPFSSSGNPGRKDMAVVVQEEIRVDREIAEGRGDHDSPLNSSGMEEATLHSTSQGPDEGQVATEPQTILVSVSSRCLPKKNVCESPTLKRIKYYGESDEPLGRFLPKSLLAKVSTMSHVVADGWIGFCRFW